MTTQDSDSLRRSGRRQTAASGHIGLIVAGSLATGLVVAVVLVAAPFVEAKEHFLTGMVLLAFALGWALLAVLSIRSATSLSGGQLRRLCSSRWLV